MKEKKENKILKIIVAVLLALLLLLIGFLIGRALMPNEQEAQPVEHKPAAAVGAIDIPGFDSMTMKAGSKAQKVDLYNPDGNSCDMIFTIELPDGKQVYKSERIKPGERVHEITLEKVPAAGTYEHTRLKYDCCSPDDPDQRLNAATIEFTLEVKP